MQFEEYKIVSIIQELPDVYTIRVKSKIREHVHHFIPGQFYHIKNPTSSQPQVTRPLSIIATILPNEYLEFCIKVFGEWSKALIKKTPGESLWLFGPMGVFTLQQHMKDLIFIAGGIGITPIVSMLTTLYKEIPSRPVTLVYANKFLHTIIKKDMIESMFAAKSQWKYIPIISNIASEDQWEGYRGRITLDLLERDIEFTKDTTFFICGSQEFTKQIIAFIYSLGVDKNRIKQEIFLGHV